jgi:DNA-binding MarR family transcriptional regulator
MQNIKDLIKQSGAIERFKGFVSANTTQTPDELFDRFLTELSHAELKVLLYIIRRTYGFKKDSDHISLKQISEGIITKEGKQLDRGAGVDRRTAMRTVKSLEEKGLITVGREKTDDGYNFVNVYSLRFREG